MKMFYCVTILAVLFRVIHSEKQSCSAKCPEPPSDDTRCGFEAKLKEYIVFPSKCALANYGDCNDAVLVETPIDYCIKDHLKQTRRSMYGQSCPMFCPAHYRPICGASKMRDYLYRSFINACYLDMANCRSGDEYSGYVQVPLEFCQRHAMKNIFKEQVVVTGLHDYRNYDLRRYAKAYNRY